MSFLITRTFATATRSRIPFTRNAFITGAECGLPDKELPSAQDVLYRNQAGFAHRLRLFHLLRLKKQAVIDEYMLKQLHLSEKKNVPSDRSKHVITGRMRTNYSSGIPGFGNPLNPQISGMVSVTVSLNDLYLTDQERLRLQALVQAANTRQRVIDNTKGDYSPKGLMDLQKEFVSRVSLQSEENSLVITVADCPFQNQNRAKALDIIRNLLHTVRSNKQIDQCMDVSSEATPAEQMVVDVECRGRLPSLDIPESWNSTNIHK